MREYLARAFAACCIGSATYFGTWLMFDFTFRWQGMAGAGVVNLAIVHAIFMNSQILRGA